MRLDGWMIMITVMIIFVSFIGLNIPEVRNIPSTFGINISETNSTLESADVENSGFWSTLFGGVAFTVLGVSFSKGILAAIIASGATIIIGLFAKGYDTSLVILPLVAFIGGLFIPTFWAIMSYVLGFSEVWMSSLVAVIFGGLAVGFIMSLVNYFAGR